MTLLVCSSMEPYQDLTSDLSFLVNTTEEPLTPINMSLHRLHFERARIAHVVDLIAIGLSALVYACECSFSPLVMPTPL